MKGTSRILLVEDNLGHARLIEKNLRRAGLDAEIIVMSDGAEALGYVSGCGAQVVLLDLNLPGIDGFDMLRRLKANPDTAAIPVVVLTTTDDEREIARCYELGCALYVTKPVDYDLFCETIRRLGQFLAVVAPPPSAERTR